MCTLPFSKIVFVGILLVSVKAFPIEDAVDSLPLYGPPPTPQYSGYLNATDGCDTEANGAFCQLHYWLALAQGNWTEKPIVLWLNGGPGGSSVLGFVEELGPLLLSEQDELVDNPYAWTQVATVFILESPVGVGFSYCEAQLKEGGICKNTDHYTASANRAALVDFFVNKFPEFQSLDFYITGESYAGVYIPTLALEILTYNSQQQHSTSIIPLQGIAVGDPCTDNNAQAESRDPLWYAHKKGLVDDAVFDMLTVHCNASALLRSVPFDKDNDATFRTMLSLLGKKNPECQLAWRKFLLSSSNGIAGKWNHRYIDRFNLYGVVTTAVEDAMERYMNRPDVKAALHVDAVVLPDPWKKHAIPSHFHYEKQYSACNRNVMREEGTPPPPSMIDIYQQLLTGEQQLRIWIFNGDADPCVSYEGTRTAAKRIGLEEVSSYRPWFYRQQATSMEFLTHAPMTFGADDLTAVDTGVQMGGEVVDYEHGFVFLTVHGAGHMVPMIRPQVALHMLTKFLNGQPLSPRLPSNESLVSMSPSEFDTFLDSWTLEAKGPKYVDYYDGEE